MLDALNLFLVSTTDYVLGWTLHFPRFAVLVLVAFGEAFTITYIQKFATNQKMLRRMKSDKTRLGELLTVAKKNGDHDAAKRYRGTMSSIALKHMKMEIAPIFVSLIPIIFLATWAFARLGYVPPPLGKPVTVKAIFPRADIGKLTHILPVDGLTANNGWIQRIGEEKDEAGRITGGSASWELQTPPAGGRFMVPVSFEGRTVEKELLVNGRSYSPPIQYYKSANLSDDDGVRAVELGMPEYKPLGIIPGIPPLTFPPWLVGDLIMVIPLSLLLKPLLRIYRRLRPRR